MNRRLILNKSARRAYPPHPHTGVWPAAEQASLHRCFDAWARRLSLEDGSQEDAGAEIWRATERYGPLLLGMIHDGILPGRGELQAAGADFGKAEDCFDVVGGRANPLPLQMLDKAP